MTDTSAPNARLSLLQELFASATHDASAAMCCWTDGLITVKLDEVREIPLEDVTTALGIGDELVTMVVLSLEGEVGGQMILTFDETDGRRFVSSLLGRPFHAASPWDPLEKSALTETGNILGCAYLNALTRLIGVELVPSSPYFIQDFAASVLQQALLAQAVTCDKLLICRIGFHREGEELDWNVLFIPTQAMQHRLEEALRCAH